MNSHKAPTWMVTLVAVFGLLTAVCFGTFLYYHADKASIQEQAFHTETRIKDELRPRLAKLDGQLPTIKQTIGIRRSKLAQKRVMDEDERRGISTQLQPKHKQALAEIDNQLSQRQTTFTTQLTAATRARRELAQVEEQAQANERAAREERGRLREKIEELSQELEILKREQRHNLLELEQVVADRTARVQELVDRRDVKTDEMISDGVILQANVTTGFVVLNRGLEHDLHEGTKFVVFNRRGGKNTVKGHVEVIEAEARLCVARVIEEVDPNDPIIPGDHIHNAIFNPHEQKIFVIQGDFSRFSKVELKRFIENAGGKVDPAITKRTDYLVAGTNASFALEEASLNGVTILSENKLLEMVRSQDRFKVRQGMVFTIAGNFSDVNLSVIERWVKVNGGQITSNVDDTTDVLLAGSNAAEAISRARLVGATIIDQSQLVHLMGSSAAE